MIGNRKRRLVFGILFFLLIVNFLFAKKDLKIQIPENSEYQVELNRCTKGNRNNDGKFIDFYFKYDSSSGSVFYRSENGWTLVPNQNTSKAIITIELDVEEEHQLLEMLTTRQTIVKDKILMVSDFLGRLVADENYNVEIMERNSKLINHNLIYYRISGLGPKVPEEPEIERIFLEQPKENIVQAEKKENPFFKLIRNYVPESFDYKQENVFVDFEAGLITIRELKLKNQTAYFDSAICDEIQICLKHDDFVNLIDFEAKNGKEEPEFDFIMKNELRTSMFQIQTHQDDIHLVSQKFGFSSLVPAVVTENIDLSVDVFNEDFRIEPGIMVNGRILFRASADYCKEIPNLNIGTQQTDMTFLPIKELSLSDLKVFYKNQEIADWTFGDSLYKYQGIEYCFKLLDNEKFNSDLAGKLKFENFSNCKLVATPKFIQLCPDFILTGNSFYEKIDIFPLAITLNIPAEEFPITFDQLMDHYGHVDDFRLMVEEYISKNNQYSFDRNQSLDKKNQNFKVTRNLIKKDFTVTLNFDVLPEEEILLNYSVIPFSNPHKIENHSEKIGGDQLVLKNVLWPVELMEEDGLYINLEAPVGYTFADGARLQTLAVTKGNTNPFINFFKIQIDRILELDLKEFSEGDRLDSARVLEALSKRLQLLNSSEE
ncbi:MAG: hypothetical protein JXQ65_09215 [Candidatus Marinimicrobia bacterium]|nr:hypothetical protein [Candidatus Neomarinimicrobiota bacterium]